ncbi:MAG: hypothetical protein R3D67_08790 [Hyphomicrobiaceae bacterium]
MAAARLVRMAAQLSAFELKALGINTNCAPVLDVPIAGAHDIIGIGRSPAMLLRFRRWARLRATA